MWGKPDVEEVIMERGRVYNVNCPPMEKVSIMRSGYSSRILEIKRVPMPAPVPPPREWLIWKPWRQSQDSASLRTTSRTESMSSAPSV